jgi:hypothetical protein
LSLSLIGGARITPPTADSPFINHFLMKGGRIHPGGRQQ